MIIQHVNFSIFSVFIWGQSGVERHYDIFVIENVAYFYTKKEQ